MSIIKELLNQEQTGKRKMEFLKHILGLCGEPHGLIHIILTFGGISAIIKYIKLKTFKK